jgi:hypothetical protein
VELPDDDMEMSKHVGVWIMKIDTVVICDRYFSYFNCTFVGYNKNSARYSC